MAASGNHVSGINGVKVLHRKSCNLKNSLTNHLKKFTKELGETICCVISVNVLCMECFFCTPAVVCYHSYIPSVLLFFLECP